MLYVGDAFLKSVTLSEMTLSELNITIDQTI